jgi:hypothetical protein
MMQLGWYPGPTISRKVRNAFRILGGESLGRHPSGRQGDEKMILDPGK